MAVTVAVFLFAAQIHGAGATVEGLASVNFASEHILAEVAQLSRHVLSVSQAAQATFLANVGKEARRLATAPKYCAWSKSGSASAKCLQNDAWATAKMSTLADPVMKSMVTRAMKCTTFLSQTACQEGSCKWDGGACDITQTAAETSAMMALVIPAAGCGWVADLMQLQGKCTSSGACKAADKCEKKTEKEPSDDGKSCISKCGPTGAASEGVMCPGTTTAAMSKECVAELPDGTPVTQVRAYTVACFGRKCPIMGTMLTLMMTCQGLTTTTCSSNSQCKLGVSGEKLGKCDADTDALMPSLIPAGCPIKGIMQLTAKCPKDALKAKCDKESDCLWSKEQECSPGGALTTKNGCTSKEAAMSTAMATSTDNKDVKLFAAVAQQQAQCSAIKTQEACTGSKDKKGKQAPVFQTIAPEAAGSTQLVASGFFLWSLFASLVGPLA